MPGRLEFDLPLRGQSSTQRLPRRGGDTTTRLLLMADFSGRAANLAAGTSPAAPELAARRTVRVDFEHLDDVMQALAPRVVLDVDGQACALTIDTIDDFHPDRLIAVVPALARLAEARDAAGRGGEAGTVAAAGTTPAAAGAEAGTDDAALLARLLSGGPGNAAPTPAPTRVAPASAIDALLRQAAATDAVPAPGRFAAQHRAAAEMALDAALRAVLREPALQAVEAAWRGVAWLLSELELDDGLELHLLDVSPQEIAADLVAARGDVGQTALARLLGTGPAAEPDTGRWTALVGCYDFGDTAVDIGVLAALGLLGQKCGAPFIGGAQAGLVGLASFDAAGSDIDAAPAAWQALRRSAAAPWIGLVAPRVLLRTPYGATAEAVESLPFEELATGAVDALLWGPAALACALVIGRAVNDGQADGLRAPATDIDGLPAAIVDRSGDGPGPLCSHSRLGAPQGEALGAAGVMALRSHRGRHSLHLAELHSIVGPGHALGASS